MSTRIMSGIQYIQSKTTWRTTERIKYPLQIGPPVGRLLLHVPPGDAPTCILPEEDPNRFW